MSTTTKKSGIKGKVRQQTEDFGKKIGMVEVEVLCINPTEEEYKEILGIELKEDSKATNYLGESNDGNNYVRVDFWLAMVIPRNKLTNLPSFDKKGVLFTDEYPYDEDKAQVPPKYKVSFFLEDSPRTNKDETKQQFINNIGVCSWAADEDTLPVWFAERDYRVANSGEEDFYSFLRTWLGGLDYRDDETELSLSWKDLMKNKLGDLKELIGSEYAVSFLAMAIVIIKGEGDNIREYQGIYNREFLPSYTMKHFSSIDYSNPEILARIQAKTKDLKPHERFVKNVSGEWGCKNIYSFSPISDFIAENHLVASTDTAGGDGVDEDNSAEY
jgi:hypothetical protein